MNHDAPMDSRLLGACRIRLYVLGLFSVRFDILIPAHS